MSTPLSSDKWLSFRCGLKCPLCGGCEEDPRHENKRCAGGMSPDGGMVVCTRIESGRPSTSAAGGWLHVLDGKRGPADAARAAPKASRGRNETRPARSGFSSLEAAVKWKAANLGVNTRATTHTYHEPDRPLRFAIVRFDMVDGEKTYRPFHLDATGWRAGDPPGLLPLYRLRDIKPGRLVFFEGEKLVDLATSLGIPNATTTSHGAGSAHKTDFGPTSGLDCAIFVDNDAAGEAWGAEVSRLVVAAGGAAVIIRLPGLLNKGDDLEQWVELRRAEGKADAEIVAELHRLASQGETPKPDRRQHQEPTAPIGRRPCIEVTADQPSMNDQGITALANDPAVFTMGEHIAMVGRTRPSRGVQENPEGHLKIRIMEPAALQEALSRNAMWWKPRKLRNGDEVMIAVVPPRGVVDQILARKYWPGLRPVEGLSEIPIIRDDGSICETPGYDEATWTYYAPNARYLPVPDAPTLDDARAALTVVLGLVEDFPFVSDVDRAVWLAALFTVFLRPAIQEPVPGFGTDAAVIGSGKTKLLDVIAISATAAACPRSTYPSGLNVDAEMAKRLTGIAMAGYRFVLFDNVGDGTTFGCPSLANFMTAQTWSERVLGTNEHTAALPVRAIVFASGNNMRTTEEMGRRLLVSRLEPNVEKPHLRSDFKIKGDLEAYVREHRPEIVRAVLTILKAHALAGRPGDARNLGSYSAWSRLVANAVQWVYGVDPVESVVKADAGASEESAARSMLVSGLLEINADVIEHHAGEIIRKSQELDPEAVEPTPLHPILAEVVAEILAKPTKQTPEAKIGSRLGELRGRIIDGYQFVRRDAKVNAAKRVLWKIESVSKPNMT